MTCKERIDKDFKLELDILIVDENGDYGLGSARWSDNCPSDCPKYNLGACPNEGFDDCPKVCLAEMYQNRMNKDYLEDIENLFEELAAGKAYCVDCKSILDAVNSVLDFWFINPIEEIGDFKTYTSYKDAFADIPKEGGYKIVEMDHSNS